MYTQCPECGTVFRVTATVLRAAQGQVRCGVCDANFDALRFLSDDIETGANAASSSRIVVDAPLPPPPVEVGAEIDVSRIAAVPRNRATADEERALAEIAASLARGAQPKVETGAAHAPVPAPAGADGEENVLEPSDVEDIVLADPADGDSIPDAALEFNLPAERWEQVFVADPNEREIPPLDLDLAQAPAPVERAEAPDEIVLETEHDDPLARTDEFAALNLEAAAAREAAGPADHDHDHELELAEPAELERAAAPEPFAAPVAEVVRQPFAEDFGPAIVGEAANEPRREVPEWSPAAFAEPPDAEEAFAPVAPARTTAPPSPGRRAAAVVGAALLLLLLAAQVTHAFRESLVEQPLVGPALASLYARLGRPVEPHWDLAGYDVRQWGAETEDARGVLRLRASIINRAVRGQPYPLLRVTLEDRFGGKIARRDFEPREYLPGRAAPTGLLGAGARADADLRLLDPGSQAVGFELDVCLPRHGTLRCGADPKPAGGG